MVVTIMLALLMQGPRNLQIEPDKELKPPLVVPAGTTIPVALINRISTKNAQGRRRRLRPHCFPDHGQQ